MPKITVEASDGKRSYEGDFVVAGVVKLSKTKADIRLVASPPGWQKSLGDFHVARELLVGVASLKGDEPYKVAARAALDAMARVEEEQVDYGR